jgi:predicted site-specific integrase-resolvase
MSVLLNNQTYYRTSDACEMAGTSRSTLLRWIRVGILKDTSFRDRKGWRLFTTTDIQRIKDEVNKVKRENQSE